MHHKDTLLLKAWIYYLWYQIASLAKEKCNILWRTLDSNGP